MLCDRSAVGFVMQLIRWLFPDEVRLRTPGTEPRNSPMRCIIDKPPVYCGPLDRVPAQHVRSDYLMVLGWAPTLSRLSPSELARIRAGVRDAALSAAALWSADFYQDWLVVWDGPAPASGITVAAGGAKLPFIVDGMTLLGNRKPKPGTYPYSDQERHIHQVLSAQLYRLDRLLAGAISVAMSSSRPEAEAQEVLLPLLEPVRSVLRKGRAGADADGRDLYRKMRDDTGPGYVRALFGEARNTAAVGVGTKWFRRGAALARDNPDYTDIEHQIPEIAAEIDLLDAMIALRIRAATMAAGEREANRVDLLQHPVSEEAADAIAHDRTSNKHYFRPDPLTLTKLAFQLGFDPSVLYPNLAFMRQHLAAARAAGQADRLGYADEDPVAQWGLRGLLDEAGDALLPEILVEARTYLRPLVPHHLKVSSMAQMPAPVPTASQIMAQTASHARNG